MKWTCTLILLLLMKTGFSQQPAGAPEPPYKKNPVFPEINLLQIDSSTLTREDLAPHHPTMLMYFSPTCEHCIHQMDDMMKRIKDLRKYQIVMATYQPFNEMVDFYKKYRLDQHPNFKIGRDTKFALPPYFVIHSLPYFALFDKKGKLIATYEGNVKVDTLLKAFAGPAR